MTTTIEQAMSRLVIAGCSRRKRSTASPVPALELYEGGCIPLLRRRLGHIPSLRARLRILSAKHGLIGVDQPLPPYERVLTDSHAVELRPRVEEALRREFAAGGVPRSVLIVAGPRYQDLVTGWLEAQPACRLHLVSDPRDWTAVSAVLDNWGWP